MVDRPVHEAEIVPAAIRLASTDEKIQIVPEMLRAGVAAYHRWDYEEEEPEGLVAAVFFSMMEARKPQR